MLQNSNMKKLEFDTETKIYELIISKRNQLRNPLSGYFVPISIRYRYFREISISKPILASKPTCFAHPWAEGAQKAKSPFSLRKQTFKKWHPLCRHWQKSAWSPWISGTSRDIVEAWVTSQVLKNKACPKSKRHAASANWKCFTPFGFYPKPFSRSRLGQTTHLGTYDCNQCL